MEKHQAMPHPEVQQKMMEFFINRSVPRIMAEQQNQGGAKNENN